MKFVLQILLWLPFAGMCQTIYLNDYYGYYIGISQKEIKSTDQLKYYMLLTLCKNFCGVDFNQPGGKKWIAVTDDIIAPYWANHCEISNNANNQIQIQSDTFFFSLRPIDTLMLKIENSSFKEYVGDTLYRVSGRRYNDTMIWSGWTYCPVFNPNGGEEWWRLNENIIYPYKPVWYYWYSQTIISDSLFNHPLTKKIRKKLLK